MRLHQKSILVLTDRIVPHSLVNSKPFNNNDKLHFCIQRGVADFTLHFLQYARNLVDECIGLP